MRDVYIVGAYETPFGIHKNKTIKELIFEAASNAIKDAGIDKKKIQAIFVGNYAGTDFNDLNLIAPYVASIIGLPDVPSIHVEDACSSGAVAIQQGFYNIAYGKYDYVLALGVEKMNTKTPDETMRIIAKGGDPEFGQNLNISAPSIFALYATRHMYEYGTTKEHLAYVAYKNYLNGSKNPHAQKRKSISVERIMKAAMITYPFGLHDVSLVTDGAAAVVMVAGEEANNFNPKKVRVMGVGMGAENTNLPYKKSFTSLESTVRAADEAYKMAGIEGKQVDIVECHDCFTITEILNIEDLGIVKKGEGGPAVKDGYTMIDGEKPVNMSGGLKAKGHPIGATGVGQAVEIITQMRGEAGERQVKKADIGITHTLGGSPAICAVNVFEKSF